MENKGVFGTPKKYHSRLTQRKEQPKFHRVKVKIDSLLTKDISLINHNMLQHSQPQELQVSKHNQLIEEYISNNYEEYGVPDPMPQLTMIHRHRRNLTSFQGEKYRRIDLFSNHLSQESELGQKEDFYSSEVMKKVLKTEPDERLRTNFSTNKRILTEELSDNADKTKKRVIRLKQSSKKNETRFNQTQQRSIKHGGYVRQFSDSPSFHFSGLQLHESRLILNDKSEEKQQSKKTNVVNPVNEVFRYCIGCDRAVLQANIPYHESICHQFQAVINQNWNNILQMLEEKLKKIRSYIRRLVDQEFPSERQNKLLCLIIVEESEKIEKQVKLVEQFGELNSTLNYNVKESSILQEEMSKLNWFLKIYQTIKQQLKK